MRRLASLGLTANPPPARKAGWASSHPRHQVNPADLRHGGEGYRYPLPLTPWRPGRPSKLLTCVASSITGTWPQELGGFGRLGGQWQECPPGPSRATPFSLFPTYLLANGPNWLAHDPG